MNKHVEIEECIDILSAMLRDPLTSRKEKLSVLDRLAKLRGWYKMTRTCEEISGQGVLNFDGWSEEELKKALHATEGVQFDAG